MEEQLNSLNKVLNFFLVNFYRTTCCYFAREQAGAGRFAVTIFSKTIAPTTKSLWIFFVDVFVLYKKSLLCKCAQMHR